MRKVIAVGQSCIDIVHVDYKPAMSYVGGRIANMAASLSRAGVPVEYVSECGQDSVGDMIVDFLQSNGVGTKSVDRFTEGLSPISLIFRDAEGRERYSEYVKYPKTRFDILWPKIEEDDIVVFGSYFSIDENVRKPLSEFLAYAQERKALLVYLPGFQPDSKIRMLLHLADQAEVVVAICASDIVKNKLRGDLGITYEDDVLRLIDAFRAAGLYVGSVVLTQYSGQPAADKFRKRLAALGIKVYLHYPIEGYPGNIPLIASEEGFGKNEYIETTRPLVIVTAPGPGSVKMATCLSQLYHEYKR